MCVCVCVCVCAEEQVELYCSVMLQKELVDKLVDEACGEAVKEGHAGLCEYAAAVCV